MTIKENIERYLWISSVVFVTYLLLGSFIVSKNVFDLVYLIIVYVFMLIIKLSCKE